MKKITHPIYKDYPEHPYISPERDLELWAKKPHLFPYKVVEKRQMQRLPEGVLPGDIVTLWRIGFDNFTNETVIPQYLEYRYGVNSDDSINALTRLGYISQGSAKESLDIINMSILKEILGVSSLDKSGKKQDLISRINDNIPENPLAKLFPTRKYKITPSGKTLLNKYNNIIQKHGPK